MEFGAGVFPAFALVRAMGIRVRYLSVDSPETLDLAFRALGFPGPARQLLASSALQGHLLVTGLPEAVLALVRELVRAPGMPRPTEGTTRGALILSGRLAELRLLGLRLQERADVAGADECGGKILRACVNAGRRDVVRIRDLEVGAGPAVVMGILNVTPDSFSDGGRFFSLPAAIDHAAKMIEEGAAILDIGGASTRPGSTEPSLQEELDRVVPVVEALAARFPVPLSVDTYRPEVMREAVAAGAGLINDIYALTRPGALATAAELGVPVCLMHMQGTPRTMQDNPQYDDVVAEVRDFLRARAQACEAAGIPRAAILLDPGFGFGKTLEHNCRLLRELRAIEALGYLLLIGVSRKSMIGAILNKPVEQRLYGSLAAAVVAVREGARIVRAHDVRPTVDAIAVAHAIGR